MTRASRILLPALVASCAALATLAAADGAPKGDPWAAARARGELRVGVATVAAAPAAGAKIRTAERLDAPVATRLAERLGLPLVWVQVAPADAARALAEGRADLVLADRPAGGRDAGAPPDPALQWVGTGYQARPKAVIRSDTPLRRWEEVRGKSVCMAGSATAARQLAEQYGAQVQIHKAPSDALVAVREGSCDIGLVDDAVWAPLMAYPEWRKFSSTLPAAGQRRELGWYAAPAQAQWLGAEMQRWARDGAWKAMTDKWARDVAFDVYLDQEVPDCHG
ncbi:ABC transporter substrate-binding protein [Bordetella genomosp. 1]|uniref:ABC transporter substrate-binding protein n=1 Tax=Bordetella genomosp. 1 TaxID=1395607 RepID=A0A261SEQ6_9BORD|nr:transporter substrate-binding domain-containing protein [Bordetella genomosp. 1]OZI35888.1 ABC transporter substrate-binding protein [Bordetella genomosp. 1]OZI58557.1 ABC transporter substrate-binding protein [Bordetella genomosp. 1]